MKNPSARLGKNDGPLVAEMYDELKDEIDNYVRVHGELGVAPTITEPVITKELLYIKAEDIEEARTNYRLLQSLGQISSPPEVE